MILLIAAVNSKPIFICKLTIAVAAKVITAGMFSFFPMGLICDMIQTVARN